MSVVVVATLTPRDGQLQKVLDALAVSVPLVHQEPGCELYAPHTDGKLVVMVERWESQEALDVHSAGDALKTFGELAGPSLAGPPVVIVLENVPLGDPTKGTIQ
jgi:quinol monooxygenase YgiN